ncbi:MAG: hypothetical protein J2P53_12290 [Bradyrhizobiaceae bacterium]|nr:hypothetical protein [Bradyrhizobiaceae bacterium]
MLTLAYGFGAIVQGDVLLDHSAVSVFRGEVLDRHISYGNRKPIISRWLGGDRAMRRPTSR